MKWSKSKISSLQTLIALSYSIVIVLMISIIGFTSYAFTTRTVEENTNDYVFQLVTQINYDIEYYLRNIENTVNTLKSTEDVKEYFKISDEEILMKETLSDKLNNFMVSRNDIVNIFLLRKDGNIIVNKGDYEFKPNVNYKNEEWYKNSITTDKMIISDSHIQNILIKRYKWVVSCGKRILDEETGEFLGVAVVDLNFNLINDMLNNLSLGEKGYMFIVDSEGNIIYHPQNELINSGIKDEDIDFILGSQDGYISTIENDRTKNYIVATSEYSGWKIVGTVYEDEVNKYKYITKQIFSIMIGLSLAVAILVSLIISRKFLHPIKDLLKGMNQFKNGNLDTIIQVKHGNEIGELADEFNDMTVEIKKLVEENKKTENSKRKYELKALQSQINPHFLYNTLDSIVWMAEAGINEDVVAMTSSLSKLFRISINRGSEFITIAQELEHIESYLKIQKLRYGSKIDYDIKVQEELLQYSIIKIIIQPIVENAIYHGIKTMQGPGFINIEVKDVNNKICIIVEDNGVGMEEEKCKQLLEDNSANETKKTGIGVRNVDQRIKLYYGEEYGIAIESEIFEGTIVTILLPKEKVEKEDSNEKK
ncbi:sensor histidine kinase [Clostridium grantii]|uniref:histidine kinase n=1 Tax=Clostridium grantii DSM 8605 TaxID=1121316 RepID=A0A1M5SB47_9CLOT|nr:sensor histidine kinase [Clostridium grantii]SHH35670.1 two-component system, sensor histidine kinase YesM [Clostridium grantii DSM 8605]